MSVSFPIFSNDNLIYSLNMHLVENKTELHKVNILIIGNKTNKIQKNTTYI